MMENSAWLKMKWRKRLLVIEAPLRLQLRSVNLGVVDRLCLVPSLVKAGASVSLVPCTLI
jgi:hypothetical protein